MAADAPVDMHALPLKDAVAEVRPEGGRTRVTFRRLAAIYWLQDDHPQHAALLAALEQSSRQGTVLQLTYDLATKAITGMKG